jgi:hypothetical protein
MAREYEIIHKEIKDADGVTCYIKTGEIVRCNDCKRQDEDNVFRSMWCHEMRTFVKPEEFCSRGKRKDNG